MMSTNTNSTVGGAVNVSNGTSVSGVTASNTNGSNSGSQTPKSAGENYTAFSDLDNGNLYYHIFDLFFFSFFF